MKVQDYIKPNQIMTEQIKWQNKQDILAAARKRAKENYGETRDVVKQFVNDNPGCSAKQIANHLGRKNATFLAAYVRRGHLKAKSLDGKLRYFPANYRLVGEPLNVPPTPIHKEIKLPAPPQSETTDLAAAIEQKAKDYIWQTGSNEAVALKRFIEWVKDNE